MALNILGPTKSSYYTEQADENEDLLLSESIGDEYEAQFRPSIADRLQVGFLRSDKHTQTNETEILDIKLISETVKQLVEDMTQLKQDLHFSKQVIEAKYKEDLLVTSTKLHEKLRLRLIELEKIHEEKVEVVRRSFKQQLQDALIRMARQYKKYYEARLEGNVQPLTTGNLSRNKIINLQAELHKNQSIIDMLEIQIEQLQKQLASKPDVSEIKIDTSELDELQVT